MAAHRLALLPLLQRYIERDPVTAARLLETMDEVEGGAVLAALPPGVCAEILPLLPAHRAAALWPHLPAKTYEGLTQRLRPEQAAGILLHLTGEARATFLQALSEHTKRRIHELLTYPANSAGRILSTDFLALRQDMKVKDAIQRIRTLATRHAPASYAYVVDEADRLVGVLNMRDLLLASSDVTLQAIMKTDVFSITGFMDREEVAQELRLRHYFAVPVVDAERRLLGVVRSDQIIGDVQQEGLEDILRMVGAGGDEQTFSPITYSLRKRLPWLYINLATAFLAAAVVGLFKDLIAQITMLAVFLPVVAGQGGNAGAQSLAVVMRGLVLREIRPSNAWRLIAKETWIGVMNGVMIGAATAGVVWLWHGNPMLGLVIGLGMIVNLAAAGLAGAAIPITMKTLGRDPAQSSNIVLTTITDCVGNFAFLGFALLFRDHLR